ncbi:DUF6572 domain-containing protein [Acinetobacter sp. ULE_I001]|uniref:DUF6572 domain-containing protein n=1 Tax=unclassified Acinetobacter TaxID=196816 RepID=UPI003AF860AE
MSITNLDEIDYIAYIPEERHLKLMILDSYFWDDDSVGNSDIDERNTAHAQLLTDKINLYVKYIFSDEIAEKFGSHEIEKTSIEIIQPNEFNAFSKLFFDDIKDFLAKNNIVITYRVFEE